ncbi:MAG: M56 family metallopeptidase, partial [Gimesia sp.]|nr:M56 family metallopeptidase [Gimesia sp.]
MHEIGVSVVWLSFQVTIVAVASALLYLVVRRRGPLLRSLVISSSMLVALLLAALAFSPWPRWGGEVTQQSNRPEMQVQADGRKTSLISDYSASDKDVIELESVWSAAWGGFVEGLKRPQPVADQDEPLTWPTLIGILFLVGATFGLIRLCIGYFLLRREIQHSDSLNGTSARELLDGLLLERNKRSSIRLLETKRLATAAIIGWWRPVILLPHTWMAWSSDQLRAVLTHELAHIEQRDYLSNISAEICRSIHFYHPLMHWLVARLRLEQELAADAAAAQSSGGAESYLVILAEMAMEQSNRSVLSPARAFLPTQSTFLRRIDMLKDKTPFRATVSRTARAIAVFSVLLAGMLAVGIRGESVSIAQNTSFGFGNSGEVKKGEQKFRIDFVPNNALAVIAARPAKILALDSMKPIRKLIEQDYPNSNDFEVVGLKLAEIETATGIYLASVSKNNKRPRLGWVNVITLTQDVDLKKVMQRISIKKDNLNKATTVQINGKTYTKVKSSRYGVLLLIGDHTLVFANKEEFLQQVIDTMQSGGTIRWATKWKAVEQGALAGMIDVRVARAIVGDEQAQVAAANAPVLGLISPIWENTDVASFGLNFNKNLLLNSTLYQEKNGEGVQDTLEALLILAKNMLGQMKRGMKSDNVKERLALMSLINVAENV